MVVSNKQQRVEPIPSVHLVVVDLLLEVQMEVSVQLQASQDQVKLKVIQDQEVVVVVPCYKELLKALVVHLLHQEKSTMV